MVERIELRSPRRLYGVILGGTALVFRHGREELVVDLWATLSEGAPVFIERLLHPEPHEEGEPVADTTQQ